MYFKDVLRIENKNKQTNARYLDVYIYYHMLHITENLNRIVIRIGHDNSPVPLSFAIGSLNMIK